MCHVGTQLALSFPWSKLYPSRLADVRTSSTLVSLLRVESKPSFIASKVFRIDRYHSLLSFAHAWNSLGAGYTIFMILCFLIFGAMFCMNCYSLYAYVDKMMQKKKKVEFDMKVIIYSLCIPACFCRIMWALDAHPNSAPFGTHFWRRSNTGNVLVVLFVKITQIFGVAAATLMILIWKQIVDAAQKMKRVKGQGQLYYVCAGSAMTITLIELPLCLGGAILSGGESSGLAALLDLAANGIFGLYLLSLTIMGLFYAVGLTEILHEMKSEKGKAVSLRW